MAKKIFSNKMLADELLDIWNHLMIAKQCADLVQRLQGERHEKYNPLREQLERDVYYILESEIDRLFEVVQCTEELAEES